MFHAVVRSGGDTLHFIAEVDGYNVQTLQQYVRGAVQDCGTAELFVEVDAQERNRWEKRTRRWLSRLSSCGVPVHVEPAEKNAAAPRLPTTPVAPVRRVARAA